MCYNCNHGELEQLQSLEEYERNIYSEIITFIKKSNLIDETLNRFAKNSQSDINPFYTRFDDLRPGWSTPPDCDKIREILKNELSRYLPKVKITVQDLSSGHFICNQKVLVTNCNFRIFIVC